MIHYMKLNPSPFRKICDGQKTIELRLFDEKRKAVQVGDFIAFTNTENPAESIQTRVTALHRFDSFAELYQQLPLDQCGYSVQESDSAKPEDMEAYYSREEQAQYGVVGIELRMTQLQKFLDAQEHGYVEDTSDYPTALAEIQNGEKLTHWMWYVFPQIDGLGWSGTTAYFSIRNLQEARDYIEHPILGARLREITEVLCALPCSDPMVIFGDPDAYKLRSCMTLFREVDPEEPLFQQALDKFCMGIPDDRTLAVLGIGGAVC